MHRCSQSRFYKALAALAVILSFAACVTPSGLRTDTGVSETKQPVIGRAGELPDAAADAAIADAASIEGERQRARFERLTDAVRKATGAPLIAGNKATPLIDGPVTFAAINKAIAEAKHSIHLETYIFADDALAHDFADALIKKRKEGVNVRVIYDAVGSFSTSEGFFDEMRAAGIEVAEFRPLNPVKTLPWRYHNRDHRKMLIVDGSIAFTGGMNISSTYASSSSLHPGPEAGLTEGWRDTQVEIEGPAVQQFQAHFLETWTRLGGTVENRADYFPLVPAMGGDIVAAVVSSGVRQQDEAIYRTYLAAVENAADRVWITQAYFAPPPELRDALLAAVKRGVDVRVIVPGFSDATVVLYASRAGYEALLRGGVRIFEKRNAFLHAKTAVVDRGLTVIGSANLDYRSFLHNNEVTAVIVGESPARSMEASFLTDQKDVHELNLKEWEKRPLSQRFKESVSSWFKYWL